MVAASSHQSLSGAPEHVRAADARRGTRVDVREVSHHFTLRGEALPVPATSIYSRYDGIDAWQACLDLPSAQAENIAVVSSHLGFGHHPAVIWTIAG